MDDFKIFFDATLKMYLDCIRQASQGLFKNWIVLFASIVLFFAFIFLYTTVGSLGMAGGFVLSIIMSLFTAQYYSWLSITVQKDKIVLEDLYRFDWNMFICVVGVSFLLYVIGLIISPMQFHSDSKPVVFLIYFFIVFACNALPEVIYVNRYDSINSFSEALRFTKDNWIEWYIPYIILVLPIFFGLYDPVAVLLKFALASPLFPGVLILSAWNEFFTGNPYLTLFAAFVVTHWYMLFRGFLYLDLSSGNRRRRIYLAKQK